MENFESQEEFLHFQSFNINIPERKFISKLCNIFHNLNDLRP